ncbi:MAG TPA: hypothetical protein VEZ11_17225 [Thermoanaerobaculia bacterium]|nr:hypothetical protein [Thermoanaerobaculia bacterium]
MRPVILALIASLVEPGVRGAATPAQATGVPEPAAASAGARGTSVPVQFRSAWLVADGHISSALVADSGKWLSRREQFIRSAAARWPELSPALPVAIHLDADFVAAARDRGSIEVVDDCHGRELCGVASDELPASWDVATLRALFTPPGEAARLRDAYAVALLGSFDGEGIDDWAASLLRARLATALADLGPSADERVAIPLMASFLRFIDPRHQLRLAQAKAQLTSPPKGDEARWLSMLGSKRERWRPPRRMRAIHGATFSLVNRIEKSLIATGSRDELQRLRALGYDAVALVPFAGQKGASGTDIRRYANHPASETDLSMELAAARAHRLGMQVLLKPQIWTGWPGDPTQLDAGGRWDLWFESYRRFIMHEALLARAIGAEWLSVGTELSRSEAQSAEWASLIAAVRVVYHGRLTYAANFDAFEKTPFWSELDAIGVDAYFPLSRNAEAGDAELRDGARAVAARLEAMSRKMRKPVILTELGYPATRSPWVQPWMENRGNGVAPADQARAFDAMLAALHSSRAVLGFLIWKYESDPQMRDPEGYLPKGKPAEEVIQRYLQ